MEQQELAEFYHWFHNYVDQFIINESQSNQNFLLKKNHTLRVCQNIRQIAIAHELEKEDIFLAEVAALFHDIGRFEQYKSFQTFNDQDSVNHAKLSIEIIRQKKLLAGLKKEDQNLIYKVIANHNRKNIKLDKNAKIIFLSKLLRDADKLDIFPVLIQHYTEKAGINSVLDLDLASNSIYSSPVIKTVLESRVVDFNDVRGLGDYKLLLLSWIFDINFSYVLKQIKKFEFLEKIIKTLPKGQITDQIISHIRKEFRLRIENPDSFQSS